MGKNAPPVLGDNGALYRGQARKPRFPRSFSLYIKAQGPQYVQITLLCCSCLRVRIQSRSLYCPPFVVPCSCQTASSSYNKRSFFVSIIVTSLLWNHSPSVRITGNNRKISRYQSPAIFLRAGTRDSRPNKNRPPKTKTRPLLQRHKTVPLYKPRGMGYNRPSHF